MFIKVDTPSNDDFIRKTLLEYNIKNTICMLKFLETPECRKIMSSEMIITQRKEVTEKFKTYLKLKESLQ